MTSITTPSKSQSTEDYAPTVQRLMRLGQEEHIPDKGMNQWCFTDGVEQIEFDHEQFTRTTTKRFMPAIEYRSNTRYLYRLPDYSVVVLWTPADYTEFDTYAGGITVPDGYELWINNEWLVLSNGISIEIDEVDRSLRRDNPIAADFIAVLNSGYKKGGGSMGGMGMGGSSASSKIVSMLEQSSSSYRWAAATTGSQNAASYQLASQKAVMAIGGFNGSDPAPTLKQFKEYVQQGLIHYYIASSSGGGTQMGGSGSASEISSWVAEHYTATTVDVVTVYDLSAEAS